MEKHIFTGKDGKAFMIRRYQSGNVVEQSSFWISPNAKPRNSRKKGNTPQRKQDANGRAAVKRLARDINGNFGVGDLLLTNKYDEHGLEQIGGDMKEAKHQLKLCMDRLRDAITKAGFKFKWIGITSELDGDTGEIVRLHHHIIVSGGAFHLENKVMYVGDRRLDDIWGFGTVDWQPMKHQEDYTPLALYLCRQSKCGPNEKKWSCSRNLAKPKIREKFSTPHELRVPAGAVVLEKGPYDPMIGTQYIRYLLPSEEKKGRGKPHE